MKLVGCCLMVIFTILLPFRMDGKVIPALKSKISVTELSTDYLKNAIGIANLNPRFFWIIDSKNRYSLQTAYQIQVAVSEESLSDGKLLWDSKKVYSDNSIHVEYNGPVLQSGQRYYWRVRVWDNHKDSSDWSDCAYWEMGLLDPQDWNAEWIEAEPDMNRRITDTILKRTLFRSLPAVIFRNEFKLKGKVRSARAYITCHGLYECMINGHRVGDFLFTPGWTSYNHRVQYQCYDVTEMMLSDTIAVGVTLCDGWYTRPFIGWPDGLLKGNIYGDKLSLLAQINIVYADGSVDLLGTNEEWKCSTGPILSSDIYNGEIYDARLEKTGWTEPAFDDDDWNQVKTANYGKEKLIPTIAPPVRIIQEIQPQNVFITPQGDTVIDMGQNMVGWIRLSVSGKAGTKVTLRHAEVLDKDGNFYTKNLGYARATNTYILNGKYQETWEPHFTFQGFRYVAVHGYPGKLNKDAFTGIVIHSDLTPTGHFECSNALVNQLQHNILWGQKGNFLEIPTDCPQRSERFGWTGDAQVFAPTANTNMNTAAFFTKWLGDFIVEQSVNGSYPHMIPNIFTAGDGGDGAAGWADAGVIIPWTLYEAFADITILERQYSSMKQWLNFLQTRAESKGDAFIREDDFNFGDWLAPENYITDRDLINTAYYARSADLLSQIAQVLGKEEDAKYYASLFENIRRSFQREFVTPNGRVISQTQTAYILVLMFDLINEDLKTRVFERLIDDINSIGHLTTGFLGTPYLNHILSEYNHYNEAYHLLMREEFPSWLHPITMGASTIWERWDGIKTDSTFQDYTMNSFNHYAFGAIGEWLYKEVAGIKATMPGYKIFSINPNPGGSLSHARAIINTLYGRIVSSWEFKNEWFVLHVEIPDNTIAEVTLHKACNNEVTESDKRLINIDGIISSRMEGENLLLRLGSGNYRFKYRYDGIPLFTDENTVSQYMGKNNTTAQEDKYPGIENKLSELLANYQSREILFQEMPVLMNSPWLSQVMGFSLIRAQEYLPENLRISEMKIRKIDNKLKALNKITL